MANIISAYDLTALAAVSNNIAILTINLNDNSLNSLRIHSEFHYLGKDVIEALCTDSKATLVFEATEKAEQTFQEIVDSRRELRDAGTFVAPDICLALPNGTKRICENNELVEGSHEHAPI